ncbi:sulfite exporter TauE/SafE family protein [Sphingobacterium suaedae]|uniref:Probable membrane transporter protein n=1 Tax=Sphingobacterium suaedae TaxID=1686402 RepID=A0ABW5KDR8_9SPHI
MYWEICLFFLGIAFVYSSVGFGGGSSYLALLAVYGLPYQELRLIALLCNVIVVTGGVWVYVQAKQLDWRKTMPLVLTSVPMAYLGAIVKISQTTFFVLLGVSLMIAALLLWFEKKGGGTSDRVHSQEKSTLRDISFGGTIGFLSGMVGIGGGIFLSPFLNLTRWDTAKKIAATASLFILVNSLAGIVGQLSKLPAQVDSVRLGLLCLAVLIGGQLGARVSITWNPRLIKRITAILVFIAGSNVLLKHVPDMF